MLALIKGKRTKRPRVSPVIHPRLALTLSPGENDDVPITAASLSSTTSSSSDDNHRDFDIGHAVKSSSTATSTEEDMARCLILLARGRYDGGRRRHATAANDVVYQCKTCDRVFASFQALGGHRASHKKPRANNNVSTNNGDDEENGNNVVVVLEETKSMTDETTTLHHDTALSLQISARGILGIKSNNNNNNSNKVHECSVCGAEFTSGQALGGHMRKHRTTASFSSQTTSFLNSSPERSSPEPEKKPVRNVLELDLNLPATDVETTKFPFASSGKEQVIVFSAY